MRKKQNKKAKRIIQGSVGIVVGVVLLYLAVRNIDPVEFWVRLRGVNFIYFLPILILFTSFYALKTLRWAWILSPIKSLKPGQVVGPLMIGFMSNNILPAHLGEFVRMYVLSKKHSISKTAVLSTIVLERVLDFLAIVGFLAVTVQLIPLSAELQYVRTGGYIIGAGCIVIFLLFLIYVWHTDFMLETAGKALVLLPRRLRERILSTLSIAGEGLYSLRNPPLLVAICAVTVIHWALNGIMLYLVTVSFPVQEPLPLFGALFLVPVCALSITIPSPPAYVGNLQFAFKIALVTFGLSEETALAASLYALFFNLVIVNLVGFYFLARTGIKFSSIKGGLKDAEDDSQDEK